MADPARPRVPTLEIRGLNVFYGASHALQGVDLTLERGVLSVVGRNGMGKTTLCKAIMGLVPSASGSIRFAGRELLGKTPAEIARLGIGYVPQGRRLWRSLTVDEHLRLVAGKTGAWSIERIYATFPRLAERKDNGGAQLSGGEQQMLAISRALLLNPRLLVMDEPTEGLAPVIVSQVEEMLVRLGAAGDVDVVVIEQNIGVATAVAETVAIMVNGRINRVTDAAELAADRELQQRLLGVGRHAHEETPDPGDRASPDTAPPVPTGPRKIYLSNPKTPTRWSQPVPVRLIEQSARTVSDGAIVPGGAQVRPIASSAPGEGIVLVAGTLDTKGPELRYMRDLLKREGLPVRLVDLSTSGAQTGADIGAPQVAAFHPRGSSGVFSGDRGESVAAMAVAFERWIAQSRGIAGIIGAGGSGGTAMMAPALRRLPFGIPKIIVSTVASGDVRRYVGAADITMMHSVADVQGLNQITRTVLENGAHALAGMVRGRRQAAKAALAAGPETRPAVGITMFGVTTPCVQTVTAELEGRLRMPRLPCHGGRRPGHGGPRRRRPDPPRDRHHHHRNLRHDDGRRPARHRGPVRRRDPVPDPLCRGLRGARHGQLRRARERARGLSGPHALPAQSADHPDAHHRGGECRHGTLDRRPAEPHGGACPLRAADGRRVAARHPRPALPRSPRRRGALRCARNHGAPDPQPAARAGAGEHQRCRHGDGDPAAVPTDRGLFGPPPARQSVEVDPCRVSIAGPCSTRSKP